MTTTVKMVNPQITETTPRDTKRCEADAQPRMKEVENGLDEIRFQVHSNWRGDGKVILVRIDGIEKGGI